MFGGDTGDRPGEFQTWVEQLPLPEKLSFPQGYRDLRYNPEKGVLGIVTGVGTARAAASIMALGMDRRFDLSRAYWLVAGIAGVNPNEASIGSAAWAEWVVDGDLGFEIDAREIPAGWPTGFIPLGRAHPYEEPATDIDKHLTAWTAYWTAGKGRFVMTAMEDTGIAQSLTFLAKAGRADIGRLMVLRTGSNYQMPYSGRSAADHIAALKRGECPALTPAFVAAYRVGSVRCTRDRGALGQICGHDPVRLLTSCLSQAACRNRAHERWAWRGCRQPWLGLRPIRHLDQLPAPLIVGYGAREMPEFQR